MKNQSLLRVVWLCVIAITLLIASAGCDGIINDLTGAYTGPPPARDPITAERAVVASVSVGTQGAVSMVLDRTRFVSAGTPRDINRVIYAYSRPDNQAAVAALNLQPGEAVIVSTEFLHTGEAYGSLNVPNWPPDEDLLQYPIGAHGITSIQRAP
jgi:hypothetical protein